jgi:hypothetical protein
LVLIAGVLISIRLEDKKQLRESRPWVTYSRLMYCVSHGCNEYKRTHGTWPNSLAELRASGDDVNERSKDMWGRDFVYIPYSDSRGYGQIISYGADGKPGGEGADGDLEVRFPSDQNVDWNNQAGLGLKRPHKIP